MYFSRPVHKQYRPNLTPLIDVIFLLIVFFLLSSNFTRQNTIELNVSSLGKGASHKTGKTTIVVILEDKHTYYINGRKYKITTLGATLRQKITTEEEKEVILKTGEKITLQDLVTAMEIIKQAGVEQIILATWEP